MALVFDPQHPLFPGLRHSGITRAFAPDIDSRDEMLQFMVALEGGDLERGLAMYFHSGQAIWETLRNTLIWRFGPLAGNDRPEALLDFASGYGRVTRHAAMDLSPGRLWVSDITASAVTFQRQTFGVHGLVSTPSPADFTTPQAFDAILVCSLFTHLPERTFAAWLERLWQCLRPGGLLAFTVHGLDLLEPARRVAPSGIVFEPVSESAELDRSEYGSTWVSPDFVLRTLERTASGGSFHGMQRGLANFQDLWLAIQEPGVDFASLPVRPGLTGALERVALERRESEGRLSVAGWVVDDHRREPVRELRIHLGGTEIARVATWIPRPEAPGEHAREPQGFDLACDLPRDVVETHQRAGILEIVVVDSAGVPTIPYAATLHRALATSSASA